MLELVGTATLLDSLKCAKSKGVVCMTGILGNEWVMKEFDPHAMIPHKVKLTVYSGDAQDVDLGELQRFVGDVAEGRVSINIDRVFKFEEIVEAHRYMESNRASGKLVVLVNS